MSLKASSAVAVMLAVGLCAVLLLAGPALAVKTVSTNDGMSLTLTDAGAYSSMTVDGNTVPTLGVAGGFFIAPMNGIALGYTRDTFYAGTAITGTAAMEGSNVRLTGTAQSISFNILLTGGLPYIKVDGTATGPGTDQAFLVCFRLPVDANGWTWQNDVNSSQTITNGSGNWYHSLGAINQARHPWFSDNPFGTVTKTTSPTMGLSLSPLFYPPCTPTIQYNSQGGFWIVFELGTTNKTTKHPNTADFHFVIYKHDPNWGQRSAVDRYYSFFPAWFTPQSGTRGGNWIYDSGNRPVAPDTPATYGIVWLETSMWDDSYVTSNNLINCKYVEAWCEHCTWTSIGACQTAANSGDNSWYDPGKGWGIAEAAQMIVLSGARNANGTYIGFDEQSYWTDDGSMFRAICNPDLEIPNFNNYNNPLPTHNRGTGAEYWEFYWQWGSPPGGSYSGFYHDSVGGWWAGWEVVHNFATEHWPYYDYSPGIYFGTVGAGPGVPCMFAPYSNVEFLKYTYEQMTAHNRPVMANSGPGPTLFMSAPWLDMIGAGEGYDGTLHGMSIVRAIAAGKPSSYYGGAMSDAAMQNILLLGIYPGCSSGTGYQSYKSLYTKYVPVLNQLDAAGWRPIVAARPSNSAMLLERYGTGASNTIYLVLRATSTGSTNITVYNSDLGWPSSPSCTVTELLVGGSPSTSYDGSGNLVITCGSVTASTDRVYKVVRSGGGAPPVANFTGNPTVGAAPLSVAFTDTSTNTPTSWSWTFGDSTTSTAHNPSHSYASTGSYTVTLTATNSYGSDGETKTNYITVGNPPVANFSGTPTSGTAPLAVTFTDSSTNSPTAWSWNFGDSTTSTVHNPSHSYTGAGTFTVALTATNAYGNNTNTKNNYISVTGGGSAPVANFSGTPTTGTAPMTVAFTDSSTNTPTAWSWTFGDSGTSTVQNPSHVFNCGGTYTVALTATNAYGNNTNTKNNYITASAGTGVVYLSDLTWVGTPTNGWGPVEKDMSNGEDQAGDGARITLNGARYTKGLGCHALSTITYNINGLYDRFKSDIGLDDEMDGSVGSIVFRVDADGATLYTSGIMGPTTTTVSVDVSVAGKNQLVLYVTDGGNGIDSDHADWAAARLTPAAGSPPVANFSGTPTIGAPTLAVTFTDSSTNTPTAWSWTFGDSNTSTVQNPSHSYTAVGSYTVALTATNAYGNNTNTKNNYITVGNKPVANFSGTPTSGAAPLAVTFTDSSTYSPTAWAWTFGDSNTSTLQNPSHTYSSAGTYTVALTATNAYGNNTNTKNNYITAGNAPVANFSGTPTTGNAPLAVSFTDSSTNSPTAWSWTFGDANTSTVQNPSHTYSSTGSYTVALTATNAYGNNTNTKNNYISVTSGAPVANFSGTPTVGVPSLAVTFTDSSTGSPTAWSWTFGDSSTSTAQNPSHTYTSAGNYTVALTATNAGGNNTMTKTNYIMACTEITLFPNSVTQFGWVGQGFTGSLADVRTDNQIYHITNSSATTYQDGRRYYYYGAYAGTNVARMYVEYQWKGTRDDTPNYHINCLKPGDVPEALIPDHLHGTTEAWDTWYTDTPANYIRADNSVYIDSCGCPVSGNSNTYTTYVDVARIRMWIKPGTTISAPTANFTGTPTGGAAPLSVTFTDSSTGTPTFWAWEFGDGTSSTVQSPSHGYAANGAYSVTLTVNNGYGSHSLTRSSYINVGNAPVANFSGTPTIGAPTLNVNFTDSSTNSPTAWSWTFGDSNTSTAQNPSHSYAAVGNYTVALTATNAYGNDTNTKNNYITVGNKPVANFSGTPTIGAPPLAVSFTDSSTYSPTAWSWTFGDSGTSTVQNPSHTYSTAGSFTVALTATNAYGNSTNTKNNYVTVGNPPVANFSGTPTTGGAPLAVTFTDSSTNTPTAWAWTFGDTNTSTVQNPSHTYSSSGTYTVALTATNAYGNNTNTKNSYITVTGGTPPVANFSGTPTVGIFPLAVTFTDSSTNTPTAWSWTFGDSNTSTAQNPSHTYTSAANYTVTLTATNAGGSDGETKTNYIMACTEITLFPNSVTQFGWVGQGFTGTLADVRTDNQIYHITNSSTSTQQDGRRYYYYGSYAPANVARLYVEYQWKGTRDDTPNYHINCLKPGDVPEALVADHLHGTTEAWDTWYTDTPANYIRADNSLYIDSCGCPVSGNTNNFTTYIDVARVRMWIKPGTTISAPTANFTGTPTTGGAPLAVTFTDSSTGTPTFWAWEFGDGASSTVQSPSHTYSNTGTYSVALTVNNGYGSNTLTRSNYITVASAPTFVAAGAVASGTGAITPALPSGIASNDILLLFLETANQAISIANQNGGTWTQVTNSPQSVGTAGGSDGTRLTVFWSRYNGTQGAPTTSDSGNHQLGRMIAIRGATTSGSPWDVTAGGTEATVDTSGAIPGATTTVTNTLVVAAIAASLPDASGTANFSAWTNSNLSSVSEQTDNTVTAGNGGGLGIATGGKATAGAYTTTSVTCGTATTKAMMSIAIKP